MQIQKLEEIFGIKINDKDLFKKALTHPSYTKEKEISSLNNYERLEFFGDAVLKLAVSKILFKKYPKSPEGELTKIRSIIVSDMMLSKVSKELNLQDLIILGNAAEKQGERTRESINACVLEALIGAFYLDGKNMEILNFLDKVFEEKIKDVDKNFAKYNAKQYLQEYAQSLSTDLPVYKVVNQTGPLHDLTFEVEVMLKGEVLANGFGKSKKEAEQKCAYVACKKLGVINE